MKKELKKVIREAILAIYGVDFAMPEIIVDYPKDEKFGDYSTNIAMVLAKELKKNPLEIAKGLQEKIIHESIARTEVVAPGYLNFFLTPKYFQDTVERINSEKADFGKSSIGKNTKVSNEFISANPTGPLHLGNGRGGFYGDSLSRVLRKTGFEVTNEFYVNDAGGQVIKLGHSVLKDEEAAYTGEYIDELHEKYAGLTDVKEIGYQASQDILEKFIKKTVQEKMQITFDVWASEKDIQDAGDVERGIEILKAKGLTYEAEGALWLKTTQFGDDKDRVIIKSDGQKAYFAGDCGYVLNKIERGFNSLIMGLGADHHGYIARFEALARALGFAGDLRFIIVQLVRLVKDGKEARMSKRAGNVVLIDDLIAEIGHDVTRFFFLMYSPDTHMNFDLGLAQERSQKNPVFYVQYAHARICSITKKAQELGLVVPMDATFQLKTEKELSLIRELDKFPAMLEEISRTYEVHKLPHYAIRLADKFHSFYNEVKVIDESDLATTGARLRLVNAVRIVLAETLRLVGVEAPEKM